MYGNKKQTTCWSEQRGEEDSHAATRGRNYRPVLAITRHEAFFKNSHNCNLALRAGVSLRLPKQPLLLLFFSVLFAAAACTRSRVLITVISQKPQRDALTNKEVMALLRSVAAAQEPLHQVGGHWAGRVTLLLYWWDFFFLYLNDVKRENDYFFFFNFKYHLYPDVLIFFHFWGII